MAKLGVSILSKLNEDYVKATIDLVEKGVDWIHYDIMDGLFVPNKSFTAKQVKECVDAAKSHFVDIHLMVNHSELHAQEYLSFADQIVIHHETMNYDDTKKLINILRGYVRKFKIGIAINPKTNVEQIYEYLPLVDYILIMSVEPGKGGQAFIPETLNKIRKLKKYIENRHLKTKLGVDGGITIENAKLVAHCGADVLISGSYITKNPTKANIKKFNSEIN